MRPSSGKWLHDISQVFQAGSKEVRGFDQVIHPQKPDTSIKGSARGRMTALFCQKVLLSEQEVGRVSQEKIIFLWNGHQVQPLYSQQRLTQ